MLRIQFVKEPKNRDISWTYRVKYRKRNRKPRLVGPSARSHRAVHALRDDRISHGHSTYPSAVCCKYGPKPALNNFWNVPQLIHPEAETSAQTEVEPVQRIQVSEALDR